MRTFNKDYHNPDIAKRLLHRIGQFMNTKIKKEITIMEVCGTHTMSIFKYGIRDLLPSNLNLISGPGCPVCVTSREFVDAALQLSNRENMIMTTFGDMLKVPGTKSSLWNHKALGKNIQIVLSPLDALNIAQKNPKKEVIFLGVGFETTAPAIALALYGAKKNHQHNFSILQSIKTMPSAIKYLILDEDVHIDGFLCPGHVSAIVGSKPFEFIAQKHNIPAVIAGFEYCDILSSLLILLQMIESGNCEVKNLYSRIVKKEGNKRAVDRMDEVFINSDCFWRGLGCIKNSGLEIREEYQSYDAKIKYGLNLVPSKPLENCMCGHILKGIKRPDQCPLYARECNPMHPIGPCMVSSEGTCQAYYKYYVKEEGKYGNDYVSPWKWG